MFDKISYRLKFLKLLKPFAFGVKRFFLIGLLLSLISMVLSFIYPVFYKIFIEEVILAGEIPKIIVVIIGYLSIAVANTIIGYSKMYSNNKIVNRVTFRVKLRMWRKLFKKKFPEYESMDVGDVKMRMDEDVNCISDFGDKQAINYVVSYGTMITAAVLIFIIEWKLALIAVVVTPLTFVINHFISKKEWKMGEGNRENDQKTWTWLYQSVPGWREVRALNLQKREERKLVEFNHYFGNYFTLWNNYWVTRVLVLPRVKEDVIIKFALYFFGGLLIMSGDLTIGSLLVFAVYYNMMLGAVSTVSTADADLQSNRYKSDRLIEEITTANINEKHEYTAPISVNKNFDSTIELQSVSYTYDNTDKEIIHDFSLKINPGERVAITGKSGAGKTTLLKLITGMVTPTSGTVSFSGINIAETDPKNMHSRIGYVMQENTLFNTTIRENLLYGKQKATDEELIKACEKAYILDFINEQPDGFDTVIGEKGIKLSGGQRQRIVLARLFLRDVDVFIFDEATSALDQYSENIIQDAIKNIAAEKTIIVVAHRESSVRLCEHRVTLSNVDSVTVRT